MRIGVREGRAVTQSSENRAELRAALQAIVSDPNLGPHALSDRNLMAGVIKDYVPDAPRETGILLAAVEHGVPETLRGHIANGVDAPTAISRTASWFADRTMYAPDASGWVVGEIALAMGLSTPAESGLQAQPPPQPQPPVQPPVQPPQSPPRGTPFQSQPQYQPEPPTREQWQPPPQPQPQWQPPPRPQAQWQPPPPPQPQAQWQPPPQPQAQWQAPPYAPPQQQFASGGAGEMTVPGQPGAYQPFAPATGPGQRRRRRMLPFVIIGVVVVLIAGGVTGALLLLSKPKPKPAPLANPNDSS